MARRRRRAAEARKPPSRAADRHPDQPGGGCLSHAQGGEGRGVCREEEGPGLQGPPGLQSVGVPCFSHCFRCCD